MLLASRATPGAARPRLAGLCCLPLLMLAACSGGSDDPEPILSSGAASESPPSPSSDPTKQPWEKRTKAGAVAFVKHWVDVFNEAGASGKTRTLADLAENDCASCAALSDEIERIYSEGGDIKGGTLDVASVGTSGSVAKRDLQVAARLQTTRQVIAFGDGSKRRIAPSKTTFSFSLHWTGSAWRVTEVRAL